MAKNKDSSTSSSNFKTHVVRDLEQAKLLADPLRLKILQAFAQEPRTTKQVADLLEESPTKLYRHVDALHEAGLLELKEERPKRGTVEKYLVAIAHKFVIDPTLFLPEGETEFLPQAEEFIYSIFQSTLEELRNVKDFMETNTFEIMPLIVRAQVKAPPEKIAELRELLDSWIDTVQKWNDEDGEGIDEDALPSWAATLAFYPLLDADSGSD